MAEKETIEERAQHLLDRVTNFRETGKDYEKLTPTQQAEVWGIQQTLNWLLEPDKWMHPLRVAGVSLFPECAAIPSDS